MSDFFDTLWQHDCTIVPGDNLNINFGTKIAACTVEQDEDGTLLLKQQPANKVIARVLYKCYDKTRTAGLLNAYYIIVGNSVATLIPDVCKGHWFFGDHTAMLPSGTNYPLVETAVVDKAHKTIWLQLARNASSSILHNATTKNTHIGLPDAPTYCPWGHQNVLWKAGVLKKVHEAAVEHSDFDIVCAIRRDPWDRWLSGVSAVMKGYSFPYLNAGYRPYYPDNSQAVLLRRAAIITACYNRNDVLLDTHLANQSSQIQSWCSIYETVTGKAPEITYVDVKNLSAWYAAKFDTLFHSCNLGPRVKGCTLDIEVPEVKAWVEEHILQPDIEFIADLEKKGAIV